MSGPRAPDGELILAIDVGLTNCKAVVFNLDGMIVHRAAVACKTVRPAPDRVEQSAAGWWRAAVESVRRALGGGESSRIAAVGVTGHMHALVLVDGHLAPIGPALVLGDRRATREAEAITAELGEDFVYACTGTAMDPTMPAAKIRWLAANRPQEWSAASWFMGCKDYVRAKMTGEVATERVDACATSLYDLNSGEWSLPITDAARAPRAKLPPILPPEAIAGGLRPDVAGELGLAAGVPVIVGAGDDVEVLGNGLLEPGARLEHLGTTGSILAVAASPALDPTRSLELYPHTIEGKWVLGGSMTAAGSAIEWAARTLGYRNLVEAGECLRGWPPTPDSPFFLPNLEGARTPRREPFARGAWLGLRRDTSRDELMMAAFEGVAMGIQSILARTEELAGSIGAVAVSAGESADPRWLQARADVYGCPLAVLETSEPTALGLFVLASTALGIDPSPADAVRRVVRAARIVEPSHAPTRERRLQLCEMLGRRLQDAWPMLAGAV